MGSARLPRARRLKNQRVIQSLFSRPGDDSDLRVVRRGSVTARYRLLPEPVPPGRAHGAVGRSASSQARKGEDAPPASGNGAHESLPRRARGRDTLPFHFGVAVGRKAGHAPARNRVKRILRERVRLRQAEIDAVLRAHGGDPGHLVFMLVFSGSDIDDETIHRDADRAVDGLIDDLTGEQQA